MHSLTDEKERIIHAWADDEGVIEMVRLYGSRAKRCARPCSDVDLAITTSAGQWPGYRVTKAVAWVIDVGIEKPAWIARHKNQTTNPLPLQNAKKAAMAMARGECGDYVVRNPIAHLNGLAARLTDG